MATLTFGSIPYNRNAFDNGIIKPLEDAMKHHHRKPIRKLVIIEKDKPEPQGHFKVYYHHYLTVATLLLSVSAILFGFESMELAHQLEIAGGMGAGGAVLVALITW